MVLRVEIVRVALGLTAPCHGVVQSGMRRGPFAGCGRLECLLPGDLDPCDRVVRRRRAKAKIPYWLRAARSAAGRCSKAALIADRGRSQLPNNRAGAEGMRVLPLRNGGILTRGDVPIVGHQVLFRLRLTAAATGAGCAAICLNCATSRSSSKLRVANSAFSALSRTISSIAPPQMLLK